MRISILGSTRGTNLSAITSAIKSGELNAQIQMVISNKKDAGILDKARTFGLVNQFINPEHLTREEYDQKVSDELTKLETDLIVLVGYMRIISTPFIKQWENKIINTHPSLLPDFKGLMDLEVHKAVIRERKEETGCTIHYVTEDVDAGPIILQRKCQVLVGDTPEILKSRVQALEGQALVDAIKELGSPSSISTSNQKEKEEFY